MVTRCEALLGALIFLGVVTPAGFAQGVRPDRLGGADSVSPAQRRKLVFERHFDSIQPRSRIALDGAVPGAVLLTEHRARLTNLQKRATATLTSPAATTGSSVMPGIMFRPSLPSGQIPTSVATGDFNRDGHMDFIEANGLDNNLWIYFGKGDGTFALPQIVPLSKGLSPVSVAAGNLRNNGILDLVVAEADSFTVGVLQGKGDGTFGYEQEFAVPELPESVVIDDFNRDGKLDIAVGLDTTVTPETNAIPYIALLAGDGTGNFSQASITTKPSFYSSAWNLASGDVNGDGLPDLLLTGPGWENSQVFTNNGDGTFKASSTVIANDPNSGIPFVLDGRLGDLNGDGCADAVVADLNTMVWVAMGDCSGNFSKPVAVYMGANNAAVRLADVNGDGKLDLITAALPGYSGSALGMYGGNSLNIALGDGKGNFGVARNYVGISQAYSIGIADFNGDAKPDFVTANNDSDTMTVYQNDGSGGFGFPQGIYAGVPGQGTINAPRTALSFSDLNKDGKMDAFFLDTGLTAEYYATGFLNDGTGKMTGPLSSDLGIASTVNTIGDHRLGDFRNTGTLDLLAIGSDAVTPDSSQFILFSPGNGDGTFAKGTPVSAIGAGGVMAVGDFNKDGKLDFIAVTGWNTHTLTPFLGNGNGTFHALTGTSFTDTSNSTGGTNALRAYSSDFNRDGKLDVLVFTSGNGYWTTDTAVWEFLGNGDGTFQVPRKIFSKFQPFALGDLNGDLNPDIARYDFIWPDGTTETAGPAMFTNYFAQNDGSFVQANSYAPYAGSPIPVGPFHQNGDPLSSSILADYNGDGKLDEVAFQNPPPHGDSILYAQFLMGNGDGTFVPTYDIFPFYGGYPMYANDLDSDGKSDMVELDNGTASVRVYKGGAAPAVQIGLEETVVTGNAGCGWVFPNVASSSSQLVTLNSSVPGVSLPSSVSIAPGALSAKFCYTLSSALDARQVFDINAQLNGDKATAYAATNYAIGFAASLSPTTAGPVYAGQSAGPITITLTPFDGYSSTVNLYCTGLTSGNSCQFDNYKLNLTAGIPATTTVRLVTGANATSNGITNSFTIVEDDGNIIKRQTITVGVAAFNVGFLGGTTITSLSPGTGSIQFSVTGIPPYQFNCSGLPAGAACTFSGNQQAFPSVSSISMSVNVPSGITSGNYPFTINASSQSYTSTSAVTLQVFNYSVQGPSASDSWLFPGTTYRLVPITIQNSNGIGVGPVSVTCAFDFGGTCSGGIVTLNSSSPTQLSLSVSVPTNAAVGTHQMTVVTSFNGTSQTYTFPFYIVSFGGTLSTSTMTLTPGTSGTVTATLNASIGFTDAISLRCAGSSPISCSFSPQTPQLTGGTPQSVTITLTASSTAGVDPKPSLFEAPGLISLAALLPLMFLKQLRRNRCRLFPIAVLGLLALMSIEACGGGGSSGSGSVGGDGGGGNPSTYSVEIIAAPVNTTFTSSLGTVSIRVNH